MGMIGDRNIRLSDRYGPTILINNPMTGGLNLRLFINVSLTDTNVYLSYKKILGHHCNSLQGRIRSADI